MGAGRHDHALRINDRVPCLHPSGADEFTARLNDFDAKPLEALQGIVWCDGADHAVHMIVHLFEIDIGFAGLDPELVRRPDGVRGMSGGNHGLGRHAPVIEAIATHLPTFDKDDVRPHLGRAGGDRQSAGSAADDTYIS